MRRALPLLALLAALAPAPASAAGVGTPADVVTVELPSAQILVTDASGFVQCQLAGRAVLTRVVAADGAVHDHLVVETGASRAEARWAGKVGPAGRIEWRDGCLAASGMLAYGQVGELACEGETGRATAFVAPLRGSPWRLAVTGTGTCTRAL